jgi:hypothetical protein
MQFGERSLQFVGFLSLSVVVCSKLRFFLEISAMSFKNFFEFLWISNQSIYMCICALSD